MRNRWSFLWIFILFFTVVSCDLFDNGGEDPVQTDKYLVSYQNVSTSTVQIIKPVFQQLEKTYDELSGVADKMKYGVWVYRINYKTTYKNQPVIASGLVCLPVTSDLSFPLLSFQNGTNTLHSNAPTENYNDMLFQLVESLASTGFVVVFPDYLGFGASSGMPHPYLHKASTITTITDMYRAAGELVKKLGKISLTKDTYLMGYSQGGWATMALKKELETNLSGEFTLKASSCGAGPYNLTTVSQNILSASTYTMPYFMAYVINSYIQAEEISLSYGDIFNAPYNGNTYISSLFNGENTSDYINSKLSTSITTLFTRDFIDNYATGEKYATLRSALVRNSVDAWKTTTPTIVFHGMGDKLVTPSVTTKIYQEFLAAGTPAGLITLVPAPGLDHQDAVLPWGVTSLKWILDIRGN